MTPNSRRSPSGTHERSSALTKRAARALHRVRLAGLQPWVDGDRPPP